MKAIAQPTVKQKKEIKRIAKIQVAEYLETQTDEIIENNMKITILCLNRLFHFGKKRIELLLKEIDSIITENYDNEIFMKNVDDRMRQIGVAIGNNKHDEEQ